MTHACTAFSDSAGKAYTTDVAAEMRSKAFEMLHDFFAARSTIEFPARDSERRWKKYPVALREVDLDWWINSC